jgi:uncharacterized protein
MNHYLYRLFPPRPAFIADMTADEASVMHSHAQYWNEQMSHGFVIAFGPVAAPDGSFGIALLSLPDDANPEDTIARDPALISNRGFSYRLDSMPMISVRS